MRDVLDQILNAALRAVEPVERLRQVVRREHSEFRSPAGTLHLDQFRKVWLLALGKASVPMAMSLEKILGRWLEQGQAVTPHGNEGLLFKTRVWQAGHPDPDEAGERAAQAILDWLRRSVSSEDLLVLALSGGGSALFPAPVDGITLADKRETGRELLRSGASIHEINAIRKHLSRTKGGRLLEAIQGATVLTLAISDVVGDDLSSIASGPAAADRTTYRDCLAILDRYELREDLPKSVVTYIEEGSTGLHSETVKVGDSKLDRVQSVIVASNRLALSVAAEEARRLGFQPLILSSSLSGQNCTAATILAAICREVIDYSSPIAPPCCLLSGGECTVRVKGTGKGGRNQQMALAFAHSVDGWECPILFASVGTDGIDGPTPAAGAVATSHTLARARDLGLNPAELLRNNDSYTFFKALDDLIVTGPTQTNVMDIQILLIGSQEIEGSNRLSSTK